MHATTIMVMVADLLTISPFIFTGGNHETITFVFDAGIAFISCGADGTVCVCVCTIKNNSH